MKPPVEELESLLFDWDAGTLDDAGVERVREILRADEEARTFYLRHRAIDAAMKLDVDAGLSLSDAADAIERPMPRRRKVAHDVLRVSYWSATAAALLVAALSVRLGYLEFFAEETSDVIATVDGPTRDAQAEPTSEGIALVTRLVDVAWPDGQSRLDVGDALPPGRLAIDSGYLQIEFFCGAAVVVEGPAELDLKTPLLARVHQGRIRAQVPPAARGFSLEVDDMTVVDLGTEFGLSVSPEGADVQVFDGEVELYESDKTTRLVSAGNALTRSPQGAYSDAAVAPEDFLDIASLESRAAGQQNLRFETWSNHSEEVRKDSRLIAYYPFDQSGGWQRRLVSSTAPADSELDGAIVGATRVEGRWPQKGGLDFKRPGDRVRVNIPGEFGSLTFACWVKIDSLDRWYNSLFLTDFYNEGEPHWQILDTGQLFFSVRHKPDDVRGKAAKRKTHQPILSPPFWKPSLSGRWIHLATTYDADTGRTTHYLNGDILHQESIDQEFIVTTTRIGAASIGNWSIPTQPDAEFAIRNLNGSMDEFAIFADALSAAEIRRMVESGRP